MRRLVGVVLLTWVGGCMAYVIPPEYAMDLEAVRRPADVAQRWGDYRIAPADTSGYTFEDELVRVAIAGGGGSFVMSVENKTEHSLRVEWNEAAYVGLDGVASRVSPGSTRVIDMEREQPPTVVPAHARSVVTVIPNDYYTQSTYVSGTRDFICVGAPFSTLDGSEARLIIPIRVQDVTNEYTFVFRVHDLKPARSAFSNEPRPFDPQASCGAG